jgi:hypothetical protein
MDWDLYWTILAQILIACLILTLPVGLTLFFWSFVLSDSRKKTIIHTKEMS